MDRLNQRLGWIWFLTPGTAGMTVLLWNRSCISALPNESGSGANRPAQNLSNEGQFMPGVGKLLKEAQKMQKKMAAAQAEIAQQVFDVSSGGGAVVVKINGAQEIIGVTFDPEFLKEEAAVVQETLLSALKEAQKKAKEYQESQMSQLTAGFQMPGFGM